MPTATDWKIYADADIPADTWLLTLLGDDAMRIYSEQQIHSAAYPQREDG